MVGCLNDLGQAITDYMIERGAAHFTFMSRSSGGNAEVQEWLRNIRSHGAEVDIVPGDVGLSIDVQKALKSCKKPVKGVIQGALALKVCLKKPMS